MEKDLKGELEVVESELIRPNHIGPNRHVVVEENLGLNSFKRDLDLRNEECHISLVEF